MLDQCPPEYRGYRVLTRHLVALVWLARRHVEAQVEAGHQALAQVRSGLAEALDAEALAELVDVLQAEQVRLIGVRRGILLVEQATQGKRYVPRL